ncbi:GFA family protein [Shewanella insulae]|uniref:GFA family protein n=1 Tax=Shewanella insulae TaxID=2681496 RepID=UPI003CE59EC0
MEMEMEYPVKGACQCGGVTYELHSAPLMVVACHCKECQKLSTSAFSITAVVNADSIEFQGEMAEWSRVADSGNVNGAKFCPTCGNRIYHFDPKDPSKIKLKPSNLSDTSLIVPTSHVWVSEKQSWFTIPDGVAVFDKQP